METLWSLARRHGLHVIEDAAHAVGSRYRGQPIGGRDPGTGVSSDAVAFSFYATKTMTTGEGGMVTTHDDSLAETLRVLCLHGISKDAWNRYTDKGNWYYEVLEAGFKYNLSDIQSAVGLHQLRKLERFIEIRTAYARRYNEALGEVAEVELPPQRSSCQHSWHLYTLRLNLEKLEIDRDEFIRLLRQRNIGTSVHFIPIPLHPFFAPYAGRAQNHCPRALELYPRLISLPLYPAMTEEQVEAVVAAIKEIAQANRIAKLVAMTSGPDGVEAT
jgi:dTDP-4-amino-4,6-dideoxygalactose transaminase